MSSPTYEGEQKVKRILRYLRGDPVCRWRFDFQTMPNTLSCFSDSDWAGCSKTRRSTSGGGVQVGGHLLSHWSRTQSCIALSSGEAELNALLKGACEILGIRSLLSEIGFDVGVELFGDSSASHGTLNRVGAGKTKYLQTKQLWLQEFIKSGEIKLFKVARSINWADSLTHGWGQGDLEHFNRMGVDGGLES